MDLRVYEADAIATPPTAPASPSVGHPTNGNPSTAQNATEPGDWWFHQVSEELRGVILEGGLTPDHNTLTQLRDAIKNIVKGGDYKASVRVASTANVAAITGLLTIDGITVVAGDRVLLKDQTTASQNGIYIAAAGAWSRSIDADDGAEFNGGAIIPVEEGTVNADTNWQITNNGVVTIGTTALTFVKFKTSKELGFQLLTTTGNFTTPADITTTTVFEITLVGGGAGGGGANGGNAVGGGGGAGGAVRFYITGLAPSTAYSVVIGAAGTGGSSAGGNGGTGGTTQITINGTVYSVAGGVGGVGTTTSTVNINAAQGAISASITALPNEPIFQTSAGIGFAISPTFSGCDGAGLSGFGTNGIGGRTEAGPVSATGYGVGGGGGVNVTMGGGAGMPGLFIAKWIA